MALFWGVEQHLAVQMILRTIYRNPVVEPILLMCFAIQIFVGLRLLFRHGWPNRFWHRVQWCSGIVLALFLCQHIGAALYTRLMWPDVDTNIYWAASVVSRVPLSIYFVPYYLFGVAAIFFHIAAFLAVKRYRIGMAVSICVIGLLFSGAVVAALTGAFFPIDLPSEYTSYLAGLMP